MGGVRCLGLSPKKNRFFFDPFPKHLFLPSNIILSARGFPKTLPLYNESQGPEEDRVEGRAMGVEVKLQNPTQYLIKEID